MKKNEAVYNWDEKSGIATCTITDKYGRVFTGRAQVCEEDLDMKSKVTGFIIAEKRAAIAVMKAYSVDCQVELSALRHLYHTMKHSKSFDSHGYEARRLFRQIKLAENDVKYSKQRLAYLKVRLHEYLQEKDAIFKKRRESKKAQ